MTWWQTLLVAVVPVALTTAALLGQQWLTERRAVYDRIEGARKERVDELVDAHAAMLEAILTLWRPLNTVAENAALEWFVLGETRYPEDQLRNMDFSHVDSALARVSIVDAGSVALAAEVAATRVATARVQLLGANAKLDDTAAHTLALDLDREIRGARTKYADLAAKSIQAARVA